jgi:hypothetical protein
MTKHPLKRFIIGKDGKFSELLSIREHSDGTITIVPKYSPNIETNKGNITVENQHISIHPSDGSTGTTIKTTLQAADGIRTYATFIKDSKEKLLSPVYARAMPDLRYEKFRYLYNRPSEEKVVLYEKIDPHCSVLYFLFVQRIGGHFPEIDHFLLKTESYNNLIIGVYITHLHIPPYVLGFVSIPRTSRARIDQIPYGPEMRDEGSVSHQIKDLEELLLSMCERTARNHTRRYMELELKDMIQPNPTVIDIVSSRSSRISRVPFDADYERNFDSKIITWTRPLMELEENIESEFPIFSNKARASFQQRSPRPPSNSSASKSFRRSSPYAEGIIRVTTSGIDREKSPKSSD